MRTFLTLIILAAAIATGALGLFILRESGRRTIDQVDETGGDRLMASGQFRAPGFRLTNQADRIYTDGDLAGRVWIAGFIFTRCQLICPAMCDRLARLQDQLADVPGGEQVRLVSISVDPEYDTPAVLLKFARQYNADLQRWVFLTGSKLTIRQICEAGFLLPVEDDPDNELMPISHSSKLVLVDRQGWIRGYYGSLDPQEMDILLQDVRFILSEPVSGSLAE